MEAGRLAYDSLDICKVCELDRPVLPEMRRELKSGKRGIFAQLRIARISIQASARALFCP